jgi:hypothetical protein
MKTAREFFQTSAGRTTAFVIALVALIGIVVSARRSLGPSDAAVASRDRIFICSETGRSFEVSIDAGMSIPVRSPHSGKNTGYPAELCYWTTDGSTKKTPTPVLVNAVVGKPGPTFCPDCGRLVVGHNPLPLPGKAPPPTEAEYRKNHLK